MGQALIAKMVFKTGKDKMVKAPTTDVKTLYDIPALDIDGN